VMLVDPDGDSTIYANSAGKILFKSHDDMDNAIVIISDDKIDEFNSYLNKMKDNGDEDNLSHNAYLRVMGDIYDIVEIKKWYHKVLDGEWIKSSINDNGEYHDVRKEKKSYIENIDGNIMVGKAVELGVVGNSWYPYNEMTLNSSGGIHSHYLYNSKVGPSKTDRNNYFPTRFRKPTRDVMVEGYGGTPNNPSLINAIYIYNRYKSQDIIINNTSFK